MTNKVFVSGWSFFMMLLMSGMPLFADDLPDPDPMRFRNEINLFVEWDSKNSFPADAVLFVGSSSIRMWKSHDAFPDLPVINRGFGGSQISDVLYFYDQVIGKYHPGLIVFYCGDNDIDHGKSAEQVFADYSELVTRIMRDFPEISFVYIPVKPSILRWKLWPEMKKVNLKIKQYNEKFNTLYYLDTATPMLNKDNQPDPGLFIEDGLHLNEQGYRLWNTLLEPVLRNLFGGRKSREGY